MQKKIFLKEVGGLKSPQIGTCMQLLTQILTSLGMCLQLLVREFLQPHYSLDKGLSIYDVTNFLKILVQILIHLSFLLFLKDLLLYVMQKEIHLNKINQNFGTICHTEACITFSRLAAKLSGLAKKFRGRSLKIQPQPNISLMVRINNRFLRERGMSSTPIMEYQVYLCIFQKK